MQKPCNKCEHSKHYKMPKGKERYYPQHFGNAKHYFCSACEKYKKYQAYLESKRQYTKGDYITSVDEFEERNRNGESLFYWNNCIRHYGWLCSMQFRCLVRAIQNGHIRAAIKKDEVKQDEEQMPF